MPDSGSRNQRRRRSNATTSSTATGPTLAERATPQPIPGWRERVTRIETRLEHKG